MTRNGPRRNPRYWAKLPENLNERIDNRCSHLACVGLEPVLPETVCAQNPPVAPGASAALPKDVYPESRFRLPLPKKEDLDDYGKRVFDTMVDPGRRSLVGLNGPAGIRMYDPKVAEMMNNAAAKKE